MTLKEAAEKAQIELTKETLKEKRTIEEAAEPLGVSVPTLYRKLKQWNLYGGRRLKISSLIFKIENNFPRGN